MLQHPHLNRPISSYTHADSSNAPVIIASLSWRYAISLVVPSAHPHAGCKTHCESSSLFCGAEAYTWKSLTHFVRVPDWLRDYCFLASILAVRQSGAQMSLHSSACKNATSLRTSCLDFFPSATCPADFMRRHVHVVGLCVCYHSLSQPSARSAAVSFR